MPTATNAGPTGGAIVPGVESLDVSIEWDDGTWPYNPFIDLSSIAIAYVFCFAPVVTGLIGSNRLKTPFLTLGGTSRTLVNVRSMFLLGESSLSRFFFFILAPLVADLKFRSSTRYFSTPRGGRSFRDSLFPACQPRRKYLQPLLEGGAVKVGVRIVSLELLDGPPGRSAVGDMAAETFGHARVEDSEHVKMSEPESPFAEKLPDVLL